VKAKTHSLCVRLFWFFVVSFVARVRYYLFDLVVLSSSHATFEHPNITTKNTDVSSSPRIIHTRNHASVPIIIHLYRAQMRLVCGQETTNEEAKNLNNS